MNRVSETRWNEVFLKGFDLWTGLYKSKAEDYYKYERKLCNSLMKCFQRVSEEKGLPSLKIQTEKGIVGKTRVDFLIENDVSFEVKCEPDYPDMPTTRKPVTNVVLKTPDIKVAELAGLKDEEARMRMYEVELDFLNLMAHKKVGIPYNYLLCLDEDDMLHRNLDNSFRTEKCKNLAIHWKTIQRGVDNQRVHYFLWQT
jgi:hypothetical protein